MLKTIACGARTTGIDCCARASLNLALPGWCASTTQVPAWRKETVEPESLQTSFLPATAYLTGNPELALAETAYVPPMIARSGAADVNSTACTLWAGAGVSVRGAKGAIGGPAGAGVTGPADTGSADGLTAGEGLGSDALATGAAASVRVSEGDDDASSPAKASSSEITETARVASDRAAAPRRRAVGESRLSA